MLNRQNRLTKKNSPGSIGHSFNFASSISFLPASTQFELRNIIGIL